MMRWTRPEILNSVRELSRAMAGAALNHVQAMRRVMKYCVSTPDRGLLLKPTGIWDGGRNLNSLSTARVTVNMHRTKLGGVSMVGLLNHAARSQSLNVELGALSAARSVGTGISVTQEVHTNDAV
jgi:hypothetical protein